MTCISKRLLMTAATIGAVFSFTALPSIQVHAKELKIATFMSPKHYLNRVAFKKLAEDIGKATSGSTTAKLYASGQLGKGPVQQYKRVLNNVAEISFVIQGYTSTIFPRTLIASKPGVGKTAKEITEKTWGIYNEYLSPEYSKVKMLGIWSNTPSVLIMKKKLVTKIEDLRGLKIRALDATNIPMMKAWGASGVAMPISKVYDALDKGVIDGTYSAINCLFAPWRFSESSKFVTDGMNAQSAMFLLAMNKKIWDGLPKGDQRAISGLTGRDWSIKTAVGWAQPDVKALARAKKGDVGLKYHRVSPAEKARFDAASAKAVNAYLKTIEKKGIPARAIYAKLTGKPS